MMAAHVFRTTVSWRRGEGDFARGRYSRKHIWRFDGGIDVPASASPLVVPKPYAAEDAVDPEEAFVAALSSCHMLTFLDLARRAGFTVDSYDDDAEGLLEKNEGGRSWVSSVTLRPRIVYADGKEPSESDLAQLHDDAHDLCFISNSVKTAVIIEPPAG
jgi:organic hydroperoxide reductase OsmC/OhrA